MASIRELRGRIASLKNIEKITRAVKMVSVAKLRRSQERVVALRPYANTMQRLLGDLVANAESFEHPLTTPRERKNAALIVIASDRGLCGSFNTNLVRLGATRAQELKQTLPPDGRVHVFCVGKKSIGYFSLHKYSIAGDYTGVFQNLQYSSAQEITTQVVNGYMHGEYDSVEIIYSEFISLSRQKNAVEQMLPVSLPPSENKSKSPNAKPGLNTQIPYIYEPNAREVFERLLPQALTLQVWKALLESFASEHGARMMAMDSASKNAGELITAISLKYNKARQGAITKEILEIVSGAEALKAAG